MQDIGRIRGPQWANMLFIAVPFLGVQVRQHIVEIIQNFHVAYNGLDCLEH